MYLRDYLHDIPLRALKLITATLDIEAPYAARIKLTNAVDRAFWDGSFTRQLVEALPEDQARLLSLVAYSYSAGVGEKDLARKMQLLAGASGETVREMLDGLIMRLLVAGVEREDGPLYFCLRGMGGHVRKTGLRTAVSAPGPSDSVPSASPHNLMEDIFAFLAAVYRDGLPLTLMGRVRKTALDRVFAGSPTVDDGDDGGLTAEVRERFVTGYLQERGLVTFTRRRTVETTGKLKGWLHLTMTERFQDVTAFMLPWVLQDAHAVRAATGIFSEMTAGSAVSARPFAWFLHSGTMAGGGYARLEERCVLLFAMLHHMGFFARDGSRYILTASGEDFFRGRPLPHQGNMSDRFMVQPNFEVIVGPELHPHVRFKLELLSERVNRDMVLTFLITREGVTRARERGMGTREILDFFDNHSRTPVPQNVRFSIESWANVYGAVYFQEAVLMRIRDPQTAKQVVHAPEVRPFIVEEISDTVFAVKREHIPQLSDALRETGHRPEVFGAPPDDTLREGETFDVMTVESLPGMNDVPELHNRFIVPGETAGEEDG